MTESDGHAKHWRKLYEAALVEHDPTRLRPMIVEAHKAIQVETRRLWYAGSLNRSERRSLDVASRYLEMLYSLASNGEDRKKIA